MAKDLNQCSLCGRTAIFCDTNGDFEWAVCSKCGEYKLTGSAVGTAGHLEAPKCVLASGWIRSKNRADEIPQIDSTILKQITTKPQPSIFERADAFLLEIGAAYKKAGEEYSAADPRFVAASFSLDATESNAVADILTELGFTNSRRAMYIDGRNSTDSAVLKLRAEGYKRLDELRIKQGSGQFAFVAMWFDASMDDAYNRGIRKGIEDAGYKAMRVSAKHHNNKIDDEIIAMLNTCSFVVADFTGHRGGVYFETGYAVAKQLPVVWTCRTDDFGKLHFDIRQYNCIEWSNADDLAAKLCDRIVGSIGPGPEFKAV